MTRALLLLSLAIPLAAQKPIRLGIGSYSAGEGVSRVAVACGNRVLSAINDNLTTSGHAGIGVMDISSPNSPTRVNTAFLSGAKETDAKAFAISPDCHYVFMGPLGDGTAPELTVWDVSAVDGAHAPSKIATLSIGASGLPYWAQYYSDGTNNYVWVALDTAAKLVLVNVTTPASPALVALNGSTAGISVTYHTFEVRGLHLYGCSEDSQAKVTNVDFSAGFASITNGVLTLNSGEGPCKGGALNYPYFYALTDGASPLLVVTDVSSATPTRVRAISSSVAAQRRAAILGNWMFVPTLNAPCVVVVYSLTAPATPAAWASLTWNSTEDNCRTVSFIGSTVYLSMDALSGSEPGKVGVMALAGSKWMISQ